MSMVVKMREGWRWKFEQGRGIRGILRRATSNREIPSDFDVARAEACVQNRIDIDPWTSKGKSAKEAIEQAWLKWFHVLVIRDRNANNTYFILAVKQTQEWGM
jgi:hypothetical protein